MGGLDSAGAWAASAGLVGISLVPLLGTWVVNLRGRGQHRSRVAQMADTFLKSALPVYVLSVALAIVSPAIIAAIYGKSLRVNNTAAKAAVYTSLTSSFLIASASILTTLAAYLTAVCVFYVAVLKQPWWKMLRVDAICAAAILFILAIAWWGRNLSNIRRGDEDGLALNWLLVIIDISLALLTAIVVGVAIYSAPKLKRRTDIELGNLSTLLLASSLLWLLRCTFVLVVDIKTTIPDWTADELDAQKIIYPILDFWVSATVLALLTTILRRPLWSDPAAIPEEMPGQSQQMYYATHPHPQPVYYQRHPQYGYQQHPVQMQPQGYYYPPPPPPRQQAPVPMYQPPPNELTPIPVPETRVYEAGGTQTAAELHGAKTPQVGK
ncbi:hypothetical protein VTI74DRAFT_11214 [Chaetomium olivicolor]